LNYGTNSAVKININRAVLQLIPKDFLFSQTKDSRLASDFGLPTSDFLIE